jgi:SAM-dependent methyltransferase
MSYEQDWNDLATLDPLWAIMSDAHRKHRGWDVDAFFATGRREVAELMDEAATHGAPERREAALDFGCGVGRTAQALAARFERCVGVDVSEEMVRLGRELNQGVPNLEFVHSTDDELTRFEDRSFDFVYCNIVLQHLADRRAVHAFLAEFLRVLTPGGLLVFRVPSRLPLHVRVQPRRKLYGLLRRAGVSPRFLYTRLGLHPISMRAVPESEVRASIAARGGRLLEARPGGDPNFDFASVTYFVTRET